jgi:PAS domain S-box-containing protein
MILTGDKGVIKYSMERDKLNSVFPSLYHKAFRQMPVALIMLDQHFNIVDANLHAIEITGFEEGIPGVNFFDILLIDNIHNIETFKQELIASIDSSTDSLLNSFKFKSEHVQNDDCSFKARVILSDDSGYLVELNKVLSNEERLAAFLAEFTNDYNESLKTLVDTSQYPFCIVDLKNKAYLVRNKAHIELENRLVKNSSLEEIPFLVDSALPFSVYIETTKQSTVPFVEEHEYIDKEGQKVYFEINGYPVISKKANSHFAILNYRDITVEVKSRQTIDDYRNAFKELFSTLPGMVFRCLNETNWTIEYASAGSKSLTGYTAEELVNNNKVRYGDLIHKDDRQMVWDVIQESIKRKRYYDVRYRIITKKGKVKWVSERGKATFDQHDQVVSIGGFITDISEGKLAEINLKKELQISESIARISMQLLQDTVTPIQISKLVQDYVRVFSGSIFSVIYSPDENGASYTLFNHAADEEIITVHPDNYTISQFRFLDNIKTDPRVFINNEESSIILPGLWDDEKNVSRIICIPAFTNNKLSGLLIMGNAEEDYNEETISTGQRFINMFSLGLYRLKAEETLQDAKTKAEESDRLKSLFLSNMSHEIRTPMNAIVGFAEMLQDTDLSREQKNRFLDVIIKSGDNLLRLINDIIDISKIEAGQLKFDYSDCLVNEMVYDLETYFKQEMVRQKKEHIKLFTQLGHPESDFALQTDCVRLKQILNNLIGNAIKFTDEGFIEYGYKIKSGFIEFFVRDSGIGIATDKQKLIFERFGQVQEAISRNLSGTGLGLTISKNLVEMLGGELWVDSMPGEGSTFFFNLPLRLGTNHSAKAQKDDAEESKQTLDLQGKTILVVEDVDTNFFYMSSLLQKLNCKIIRAHNGQKAIDICKKDPTIDLVLMDIELPVLDGYKATAEIKKFKPDLPIIAQTAFAMMGERERSREAGCNDYLAKPIRKEELITTLKKYL